MNPPIPPDDDRAGPVDRELFGPPSAQFRFWLAMALPAGALLLQWEFWDYIRPFVWFFFYPAVFFSAWIGGKAGGIGATLFSAGLVVVFFFPPEFAFTGKDPRIFPAGVLFITMGIFLSYFHDHLRRAKRTAADALESARLAHAQLEARVLERTAELERSTAGLRDREELSSSALRLSPDCMLMIRESDGTVIMANEATGRLAGVPSDQIVGRVALPYTGWLSDDEREGFVRALRESGECLNHETRLKMPDGRLVACSLSARRISRSGEDCLLCVVRDLTERRRAESANVTVAAIVESSDDAIVGSDLGGTVTSWNRGAERIFGFSAAEMVGCPLRRIVPPDRLAEQERILVQVAQGFRVRHLETVRLRKDGTPVEISVTISPIKDDGGRVVGASKIARDITERKRTEAALRRAREQFAGMAASSPSVLCSLRLVADGRRVFDYAAPGIEGIFGVTAEEIVRDPTVAIGRIEASDQEESRTAIEESARTMAPLRFRFRVNHPRKGLIWVEGNSVPTRPAEGGVVWHGVMTDVTVQTRAEHALRESESRYRSLVDNLPAGVFRKDAAGRFVFVSGRFCEVEGFGPEMFLGRTATEVAEAIAAHPGAVTHDWRQTIHQTYRGADHHEHILRTGQTIAVEEKWVTPGGGGCRYFQAVKTPVYGEGGAVVGSQGVLFEVTDQKRAEAALRESDERLRSLGDNLPDSYVYQCTRAAEGPARFLYLSAGVEKLHGLTAAEVIQDASRLYRQIAVEQLTALAEAEAASTVDLSDFTVELHVRRTDGEWRWLQLRSRPRWTADGQLLWDGVATDVTAKREAEDELRRTTRWLFASQRISATGGWALNLRTGAVWASPEARRIYDCDLPSLTQADIGKLPLPEHRPALDRALCELVELGRPYDVEFEITRGRDGRRAQIRSLAEYEAGEGLVIGVVQDITRQKDDERTLRVTQFSMEHSGDGIFWLRPDGSYFRVNEATARLTGYSQAELLTMAAFDLNPSRSPADWANHWRELCEKKVLTFETHFRTKDGRVFPVEVTSNHIAFEGQEFSCAFVRDTTERNRAEEALRASEEEFRKMFEVASVGMAQADPATGRLARVNGKMAAITGYSTEELCRMRFSELTHPDDRDRDWADFQRLVDGEITEYHLEKRYVRKDGEITWVNVNVALVRDLEGRPLRSMAAIEDITERRRADEALRFHKAILEETGRIAKVGGWSFDAGTGEGFWTDEVARIHDLDPAVPVNRDAAIGYYVEKSRALIEAAVQQAVAAAVPYDLELELLSARGVRKWVRTIGHPTVEDGRVVRLHGSFQDITERKLAEQRLWEKEQLLHATDRRLADIVQGMTEACFALDREWRFTFVNDRGETLLRHTRAEMVGHPIWEVFRELVGTPMEASYRRVMAEREPVAFEAFSPVARCWLDIRLFPTAEGVAAFLMDISERKRGEEEREKLARLIEHSRDFIAIADLDGRITFMNAGAQAMIGLPPDRDPKTLRIEDYIPEQWQQVFRETIIPAVREQGLWQGEMQLRNLTTGAVIDVFRSTFLIRDVAGRPLCLASVTRDITEEKRANEKLADERNLLRTLFDLLPDYIYVKDSECRFIACNDRCAERFGLPAADLLIGQTDRDLFPAEIAAQFEAEDREVLRGIAVVEREESCPRPGGDRAVVLVTKVPLRDGQGNIVGIVGCNRDVTNRKRNEEAIRRLNAELEQRVVERTAELKDANRELEAFSYSVSHDLRAPLRAVDGFSRALEEDFGAQLPKEGLRQIQTIRASAQRMGELIDDLLSFSRLSRQPLTLQPVEMDRLVRSVLADLADESRGRTVELTVGAMPACDGDPRLLRQVWINLISNALKYTRRQATAVIEIGCAPEAGENAYFIRDNGTGFDMQYAGKLFGVFQRLHRAEDFEGSGVGLAIVQRVVHRHGGRVWAEAAVGRGATFRFTLGTGPKS